LYDILKNVDIVWSDLKSENLVINKKKVNNYEWLEPAIVGNIMRFAGADAFKRNKIYNN